MNKRTPSGHVWDREHISIRSVMPKSKRSKVYSLTSTQKKGPERKSGLIQEIKNSCDKYANVFVYGVENMRNAKIKDVRTEWKHSRFFFGNNRIMQVALGKTTAEEYKEGLHHVSEQLHSSVGLLFTNKTQDEVRVWFDGFTEHDYARAGFVATQDVTLPEGPLQQFPHSVESHLRQLGLPTTLNKGVVTLIKEHTVCTEGDTLTPEQAKILKLLDVKMADFRIALKAVWSQDGSFQLLGDDS